MVLLKEQCVSISEFKKDPNRYLKLSRQHPVYLFSHNKLVGKLVDPNKYVGDDYSFHVTFDPPKDAGELLQELREDND